MKKFYLIILFAFLASFGSYVSAETWTKVTTAPTDWSGDYLIVYEAGNVALDGNLTKLDVANNTQSVTISDGTITTDGCDYYFTIEAKEVTAGTYAIKNKSGYYIGRTSTKDNEIKSSKTTKYTNTLSLNTGGDISIISGGAYLRYNDNSGQKRFRYYSSGQQAIHLYKKAAADQVATPKFTVDDSHPSYKAITASATTATEGATVHYSYTKNGVEQTHANDTEAPVLSTVGTYVVTAIAKDATGKLKDSYPATATYTITAPAAPTADLEPGTYNGARIVTLTSPEGTTINGFLNNETAIVSTSETYSKELIAVEGEKTTYTFEVWTEYNKNSSEIVTYTYTIDPSYVPDSYILCTDIKYLTPGTKVIFVGSKADGTECRVMTDFYTASKSSYRKADATNVEVSDDGYTLKNIGNAVVFTVAYDGSATDNYKYSFFDSKSYLGSGTKDNSMTNQTAEGGFIPDKAKWSISLDANKNYNATILAKTYYSTYPYLRYNSNKGNQRFACYQSSFAAGKLRIYFNAKTSGVEKVALTDKKAKVYGANGNIVVEAETAADVNVYNAAGMLVAAQKVGAGRTNIALAKGFYVVRAGNTVTKVAVR